MADGCNRRGATYAGPMTDSPPPPAGPDGPIDARLALKDELWGMGVPDADAELLIGRWEAHAREMGIAPDDPAYWSLASAWIDRVRGAS